MPVLEITKFDLHVKHIVEEVHVAQVIEQLRQSGPEEYDPARQD